MSTKQPTIDAINEIKEAIYAVDTSFDMGDKSTITFLPPNFYVDRLVTAILALKAGWERDTEDKCRMTSFYKGVKFDSYQITLYKSNAEVLRSPLYDKDILLVGATVL